MGEGLGGVLGSGSFGDRGGRVCPPVNFMFHRKDCKYKISLFISSYSCSWSYTEPNTLGLFFSCMGNC